MERKCTCGGEMTPCELTSGIFPGMTVSVPDGYNFPKQFQAKAYICKKCGKIELYAENTNDIKVGAFIW